MVTRRERVDPALTLSIKESLLVDPSSSANSGQSWRERSGARWRSIATRPRSSRTLSRSGVAATRIHMVERRGSA